MEVFFMSPTYVAVHELRITLPESEMKDLEQFIREQDGIENPVLVCINDAAELAELLEPLDFNDARNWSSFVVMMIPNGGKIKGYRPLRLVENFKKQAKPGMNAYRLFYEILELAP
jgi:hypothetical protein